MAKQQKFEALKDMIIAFKPIVLKDKDIIEFLQKSNIDEDGVNEVVSYLTACAAGMYLMALNKDKYADDIEGAQYIAHTSIENLSKRCDQDVSSILEKVLKENIEEWFEIMSDMLHKNHVEDEDDENPSSPNVTPERILGIYGKILFPILLREEDVTEFLEEYDKDLKNDILSFLCSITLWNWASYYADHREELAPANPLNEHLDGVIQTLEKSIKAYGDHFQEVLEDFDEFYAKVKEIIEDHLAEFLKKMDKSIAKIIAKNRQ